jgi:hypothetical protein
LRGSLCGRCVSIKARVCAKNARTVCCVRVKVQYASTISFHSWQQGII